ncbi:MAG: AlpA family transcriptional regulator [Acidobacteria bacterium]|nr:MAG: AlpA family transcriptional regulator [Acidobacteriota bacterium]
MEILTVLETAQLLRVGKNTVYRALECGELPGFKIRGCWRIERAVLDEWVRTGGSQPHKELRIRIPDERLEAQTS